MTDVGRANQKLTRQQYSTFKNGLYYPGLSFGPMISVTIFWFLDEHFITVNEKEGHGLCVP
jgi:hypothetical protein